MKGKETRLPRFRPIPAAYHEGDRKPAHNIKVYGSGFDGCTSMSVPHLDTRYVDVPCSSSDPYAGFKTDFLEQGSVLGSAEVPAPANLCPMTRAGLDSLLGQVPAHRLLQGKNARLRPCASIPRGYRRQWELIEAGQRSDYEGDPKEGRHPAVRCQGCFCSRRLHCGFAGRFPVAHCGL